jgi:hypothetical protein
MTHHNDGAVAVARDQSRIESLSVARSGRYTSGHVHSKKRLCLQSYKSPRYLRGGRSGTLKAYASFKVRKSEKQAPARLPTERGVIVSSVLAATVLWYLNTKVDTYDATGYSIILGDLELHNTCDEE